MNQRIILPWNQKIRMKRKKKGNKSYDEVVEIENGNENKNKSSSINPVNPTENSDNDKANPDLKSTYVHIEKIIGMSAYDNNAHLIGNVQEIGLRKLLDGKVEFSFKIKGSNNEIREIEWNKISKIGDIIILAAD